MTRSNKKKAPPATAQLLDGRFDMASMEGIAHLRHAALRLYLQGEITSSEHNVVKQALTEARRDFEVRARRIPPVRPAVEEVVPAQPVQDDLTMPEGYDSDGPFGAFGTRQKKL